MAIAESPLYLIPHYLVNKFYPALVFAFTVASAPAASIAWSATPAAFYGFDLFSGADVPVGALVRVGNFNITDTVIQQNALNVTFLNSNFVEAGFTTIGTGAGNNPGFFSASSNYNAAATGLAGKQVYFWVFSGTTVGNSAQIGIFYQPLANNSTWAFPSDTPTPGSTTVAISDLISASPDTLRAEAKVVVGTFGPGTSTLTGRRAFTLSNIPEPGSAILALAGGLTMLARRRRS